MSNEIVIKASKLNKFFNKGRNNEVHALKDIDLEIKRGDVVSIVGASGSGKTTLLNSLSGLDNFNSGEVFIDSKPLSDMPDSEKTNYRASKMGFIFQTFNLIPVLTALENVEMPLIINGISKDEAHKKAKYILETVGLSNRINHKPNELSGGQRQRVTIARALVHNPKVVWADEPTGNLDSLTADKVFNLILELNHEFNSTLVLVTHDMKIADQARRKIVMKDGAIKN